MINEHAFIHPTAKIGKNVQIGPWSYIDADVEIGDGTVIESHVVIKGPTKIGKNNHIFQFASIGERSQDKKDHGNDKASLEIGDGNTIRESVTINRGTEHGGGITKIGSNNWLMACAHIAHDCIVGNNVIFANYAALAGHVTICDNVIISGYAAVNQFCTIGSYTFVSRATYVPKDVLPYVIVAGYSAKTYGLNREGLKRNNFDQKTINGLRQAYKIIVRKGFTKSELLQELNAMLPEVPEVKLFIDAIEKSKLGVVR